jgi:hypothetical protein
MTDTFVRHLRLSILRCIAASALAALLCGAMPAAAQDASKLYGVHGVSPLAVRQGILGTCYFHASLAEVAKVAPDTLRNDITPNPGGGYKVHFFQGPDETVFDTDIDYGRAHSYDHSEGSWVLVLMRGYAQRALRQSIVRAINESAVIPSFVKPMTLSWLDQSSVFLVAYDRAIRAVVSQDGDIDKAAFKTKLAAQAGSLGIPPAQVLAFTGFLDEKGYFDQLAMTVRQNGEVFGAYKSLGEGGIPVRVIESFMGGASAGQVSDTPALLEQLRLLHQGSVAVVAGTKNAAPSADFEAQNKSWWVDAHAYSVMDFDEAAQTITLRNPWGARPGPDGVFTIPMAVFLQSYDAYSYSKPATQ